MSASPCHVRYTLTSQTDPDDASEGDEALPVKSALEDDVIIAPYQALPEKVNRYNPWSTKISTSGEQTEQWGGRYRLIDSGLYMYIKWLIWLLRML